MCRPLHCLMALAVGVWVAASEDAVGSARNGVAIGVKATLTALLRARTRRQPMIFSDYIKRGEVKNGIRKSKREVQDTDQWLAVQPRAVSADQEQFDFEEFDENGNGHISMKELADNFSNLGLSKKDLAKIYSKLDLDNNGDITWQEFNTPLDIELFDFLDRTHNLATGREIEFVENLYTDEFGNPYASMRDEPASEYNERGEEIEKPDADEKYLKGYGWFKDESPVIDAMYPNIQKNPDSDDDDPANTPTKYAYSYGFLQKSAAHRRK